MLNPTERAEEERKMIPICSECRKPGVLYDVCTDGHLYRCSECDRTFYFSVVREIHYYGED